VRRRGGDGAADRSGDGGVGVGVGGAGGAKTTDVNCTAVLRGICATVHALARGAR
jgi:hypothetical protein